MPTIHAKYSPSGLKNLELCPGFVSDKDAPIHPVTLRGTIMHEAMETGDDSKLESGEHELIKLCREFLKRLETDYPDSKVFNEVRLQLPIQDCFGTVDYVLLDKRRADVVDFKFGFNTVDDPEINAQAHAYVAALFHNYPDLEFIRFSFLIPRRNEVLTHGFFREKDYDTLLLHIKAIIARAESEERRPKNELCEYCGNRSNCSALFNTALPIAKKYSDTALPEILETHSSEITKPDHMAKALFLANILEPWCKSVKKHALAMRLDQGLEIEDPVTGIRYELKEKNGARSINNAREAGLEAFKHGINPEEFLECCKVQLGSIEKLIKSKAPRGEKSKQWDSYTDTLSDKECITSGASVHYLKQTKN
jgi:hypothetical protein